MNVAVSSNPHRTVEKTVSKQSPPLADLLTVKKLSSSLALFKATKLKHDSILFLMSCENF